MPIPLSPKFETELFDRQRRRRQKRRETVANPYVVSRMTALRRAWPTLSPGIIAGFANSPLAIDHPYIKRAAQMTGKKPQPGQLLTPPQPSSKKKVSNFEKFNWRLSGGQNKEALDFFFTGPGKFANKAERWQSLSDERKQRLYGLWQRRNDVYTTKVEGKESGGGFSLGSLSPSNLLGSAQSFLAETAGPALATTVGATTGAVEEAGSFFSENSGQIGEIASYGAPGLIAGARATTEGILSAAQGGGPVEAITTGALPGRDILGDLSKAIGGTQAAKDLSERWDETFGKVVKPAVRWASTAANAPYEVLTGRGRAIASGDWATAMPANPWGIIQGIKEVPGLWEQTTIGQAASGEDLGEGYLPGGEAVKAQSEAARKYSPYLPGGHAWTFGRGTADLLGRIPGLNEVFEPDSFAWELTSGLVDARAIWKYDPSVLVGKGTSRLRESAKSVKPEEHGADVARAFKSPKGKKLLKTFQETETAAGVRLAGATGMSNEGVAAIAATTDADEIVRIVANDTIGAQVSFLQEAGAHYAHRRWTHPLTQKEWLAGKGMSDLKNDVLEINQRMVRENGRPSPAELRLRLGPKFPGEAPDGSILWTELAQTQSAADIDGIFYRHLGLMPEVPAHMGPGYTWRRAKKDVRAFGIMPNQTALMTDNIPQTVEQLDRLGLNARVPWEERRDIIDDFLANPNNAPARGNTIEAAGNMLEKSMIRHGLPPEAAKRASRIYRERMTDHGLYITGQVADSDGFYLPGFVKDGKPVNFAQNPLTEADFLQSVVPMPDVREIRQATSTMTPILRNPAMADYVEPMAEWINRQWKFFNLARPAWPVRVVGEGQFRMATAGLDAFPNHPWPAFLAVIGTPRSALLDFLEKRGATKLAAAGRRAKTKHGKYDVSVRGAPLAEEDFIVEQVLNKGMASITEPYQRVQKGASYYDEVASSHEAAHIGLTTELGRRSDPVMRKVLSSDNPDEVKEWFWSGDGAKRREYLASSENLSVMRDQREFSDVYIDSMYELANVLTGHDERLLDALRTGKIESEALRSDFRYNPAAAKKIRKILDEGAGPAKVKIDVAHLNPDDRGWWDKTTHFLMYNLMGRPENVINRNATARQFYWKHAERIAPYLDPSQADELIKNARAANLEDFKLIKNVKAKVTGKPVAEDVVQRLRDRALMPTDPELKLTLEQLDIAAQGGAVKDSLGLLYDLSRKHQFWDMVRFLIPFGEAWHEVLSTWAKIFWKNPAALRHAQVAIEGARESGIFHKNDFGQDVVSYPGSEWINQHTPEIGPFGGMPGGTGGFEFDPKALNIGAEMLPGVGWAGQLLASAVIPDTPDWDWARERLFPYGAPEDTGNPLYNAIGTFGGSFIQRVTTAFTDPDRYRAQGSLVHHALEQLKSTGDYQTDGPRARQEKKRLENDAKDLARRMKLQQAIIGAFVPAAPQYQFQVKSKTGEWVDRNDLYKDWQKFKKNSKSYDEAIYKFAKKHGDANLLITQAFSEPQRGHLPFSVSASTWARANSKLRDLHPEVYGLLAPGYEDEDFDSEGYDRLFLAGERTYRTAEDRLEAENDMKASYLYRRMQEELGDLSDRDRVRLAKYREQLRRDFPGFDPRFTTGETEHQVGLLQIMLDDAKARKAAAPGVVKAAREYLKERQWAVSESEDNSLGGEADTERRNYLYELGNWLSSKYPNFKNMWDNVFRYEVED